MPIHHTISHWASEAGSFLIKADLKCGSNWKITMRQKILSRRVVEERLAQKKSKSFTLHNYDPPTRSIVHNFSKWWATIRPQQLQLIESSTKSYAWISVLSINPQLPLHTKIRLGPDETLIRYCDCSVPTSTPSIASSTPSSGKKQTRRRTSATPFGSYNLAYLYFNGLSHYSRWSIVCNENDSVLNGWQVRCGQYAHKLTIQLIPSFGCKISSSKYQLFLSI